MTRADKFLGSIKHTIQYFCTEFDLTYAEAIGVLEIAKHELLEETLEETLDEAEEDNGEEWKKA